MSDSFINQGRALLNEAWTIALHAGGDHVYRADLAAAADQVFAGTETGYQKAIIIQAAGKAANPQLDAQSMQKGEGSTRSWDAREFAKKVFVPWNQASGAPFSHAADPYVSNPYRIVRFDASVRQKRKKPLEFDSALEVLEILESANDNKTAFENLVEVVYSLRRFIADRSITYPLPNRASLLDTLSCITDFASAKSGGARLQAIVYALIHALRGQGMAYIDLKSGHVNSSDTSTRSAGDVSFQIGDDQFAIEVKDRPLSQAELEATIEKCRLAKVREMLFVIRANALLEAAYARHEFNAELGRQFSSGLNIYVQSFDAFAQAILTLLGEDGRRIFLEGVGTALAEQNADIKHKWAWASLVKSI